eukprot:scaffold3869_cov209-Prasinococcus_capsulatus_cf.AAC.1
MVTIFAHDREQVGGHVRCLLELAEHASVRQTPTRGPVLEKGLFHGYDSLVVVMLFNHALSGLAVSMVMKYADNIVKVHHPLSRAYRKYDTDADGYART